MITLDASVHTYLQYAPSHHLTSKAYEKIDHW